MRRERGCGGKVSNNIHLGSILTCPCPRSFWPIAIKCSEGLPWQILFNLALALNIAHSAHLGKSAVKINNLSDYSLLTHLSSQQHFPPFSRLMLLTLVSYEVLLLSLLVFSDQKPRTTPSPSAYLDVSKCW